MDTLRFQPELQQFIDIVTLDTCPRAILLQGPSGCGKDLFARLLSEKLDLQICDLTQAIIDNTLDATLKVQGTRVPTLYNIYLDQLSLKDQNALLRTVEKPACGAYLVLHAATTDTIATLVNRCQQFTFREYSKESLQKLYPETAELLLQICETPGQVECYQHENLNEYVTLVENMFNNFARASISSILTISNRFKWTSQDEISKLDVGLFCKVLLRRSIEAARAKSACIDLYRAVAALCVHLLYFAN